VGLSSDDARDVAPIENDQAGLDGYVPGPLGGRMLRRGAGVLRAQVGNLPRAFWVLWAGTLINMVGTMLEPYLALYLVTVREFSLGETGAIVALLGAGSVASQFAGGVLADRVGRRATLSFSTVATGAAILGLGYANSMASIAAAALLVGLTREMYRPASMAVVADVVSPEERPRAFGLLYWAINLGWTFALIAGGALAQRGFIYLFWVDALTCVGFGLLVWRAVPETRPAHSSGATGGGRFADVFRDRILVAYAVIVTLYTAVALQGMTTLPLAMRQDGLGPGSFGLAMAVNGVVVITVQPLLSAWLARRDYVSVLAAGFALVGIGYGLTAAATELWAYAATVMVWSLGEVIAAAAILAVVADLAPQQLRGRYSGLHGVAWSLGLLVAPVMGTQLLALGSSVLWLSCLGLALVSAAALLSMGSRIRGRVADVRKQGPQEGGPGAARRDL
jgi:MFS family permease